MATYADKSFDSNNYLQKRPGYPDSIYEELFKYHQGDTKVALDLGCGPGTASFQLLPYVDKVIGVDPSEVMIQPGINAITPDLKDRIEFRVGSGEDLSGIADHSVDLIISAEAFHWVNHSKFFEEAKRVLKPNGTFAHWGYIEPIFIDFPIANEIYENYVYEDPQFMKDYWKPGKIFHRNFFNIDLSSTFKDIEKYDYYPTKTEKPTAYYLKDYDYSVKKFREYLSSWSAVHDWRQINQINQVIQGNNGTDIIDLFVDELKRENGWDEDTKLRVEWGTTYCFSRLK